MRVLIVGNGARERAIYWKLSQSFKARAIFIEDYDPRDRGIDYFIDFCKKNSINIVIIGPEKPLEDGLSDRLRELKNVIVFGPSKKAAEIETSKAFAKDLMRANNIPTANYHIFSNYNDSYEFLKKSGIFPIVIKLSGIASGKGVFIVNSLEESKKCLEQIFVDKIFGNSDIKIVIEDYLVGEEASLMIFTDGKNYQFMPIAKDYKKLHDNDCGPNTGGMGAYAPVEAQSINLELISKKIVEPILVALRQDDREFVGVLYLGLMITKNGAFVLEFNARFGDPETQVIMPLLSTDLIDIIVACHEKKLDTINIKWKKLYAACVVITSKNYPYKDLDRQEILDLDLIQNNVLLFPAAIEIIEDKIYAKSGRVLSIVAVSEDSVQKAAEAAYLSADIIQFTGKKYRRDIGFASRNACNNYEKAGVNINNANEIIDSIKNLVRSTYNKNVLNDIGSFGGMFGLEEIKNIDEPVLVASTDGVGTKTCIAAYLNSYTNIGRDIVNHCVNDILVQGAKPLFFMDYVAASSLSPKIMNEIIQGITDSCKKVDCVLLGGETAEMPGVYKVNKIDVAGTIVGLVDKKFSLPKKDSIKIGDILVGFASSGLHTNGYSLARKILEKQKPYISREEFELICRLLLVPHREYFTILKSLIYKTNSPIKALVHITGGGFIDNIPRILPDDLSVMINQNSWPSLEIFDWIKNSENIDFKELYRVFNMGIGLIAIIEESDYVLFQKSIDEELYKIGKVVAGKKEVIFHHE